MKFLLLALLLVPAPAAFAKENACQLSTQATLNSCQSAAQSSYSATVAGCDNDSKSGQRKACLQQAKTTLKKALSDCDAQSGVRLQVCKQLGGGPYDPQIDPANFTTIIDNPYFPLKPGTTYIFEGHTKSGFQHNEFAVTTNTVVIQGVTCVEVHDTLAVDGVLAEDTRDWFAQDKQGNVWYFGENSAVISGGLPVSLGGTWTGGVSGARPGIVMEAHPAIGDFYRQEFQANNAEDLAAIFRLHQIVTVPIGTFDECVETKETSPLEPGLVEYKWYAPGIGNIKTNDNGEVTELVEIKTQ
jgi:hypothetical protein